MRAPVSSLPDLDGLTRHLSAILSATRDRIEVVERRRPRQMSTFPIEIVTCRLADGTPLRVFLKYESNDGDPAHGHRRGVTYEGEVYRRVLGTRNDARPRFLGTWTDHETGTTCLALEDLRRSTKIREIRPRKRGPSQEDAMVLASRWIARFHVDFEGLARGDELSFLTRYEQAYYAGWVRRTRELTAPVHATARWLPRLCERGGELLAHLANGPRTVIHGEFYSNNILLRRRQVHVVDWEAAAIGPGVIDLAALTEGSWPPGLVRRCEAEYRAARWPHGAPADFERTLASARLYLHFRWLGERAERTMSPKSAWRLDDLRATAEALGLVDAEAARAASADPTEAVGVGVGED